MNEVAIEPQSKRMVASSATSPGDLLRYAMDQGADIEKLERLLDLQQKWEANEARKAYHHALSAFKAVPLTITKNKLVSFPGRDNKPATEFYHATLGNVVATIAPALGQHQLSHSWDVRRDADRVHVTCKLTHALGHSESITLDGPLDNSGSKNNIQSVGSTITYLERYTLLAITGLATEDQDDDGALGAQFDHPRRDEQAKRAEPKAYPQADFDANLPKWRAAIEAGKRTADDIVAMVQTKGTLSTEQITAIRKCVRVDDAEVVEEGAAK